MLAALRGGCGVISRPLTYAIFKHQFATWLISRGMRTYRDLNPFMVTWNEVYQFCEAILRGEIQLPIMISDRVKLMKMRDAVAHIIASPAPPGTARIKMNEVSDVSSD